MSKEKISKNISKSLLAQRTKSDVRRSEAITQLVCRKIESDGLDQCEGEELEEPEHVMPSRAPVTEHSGEEG